MFSLKKILKNIFSRGEVQMLPEREKEPKKRSKPIESIEPLKSLSQICEDIENRKDYYERYMPFQRQCITLYKILMQKNSPDEIGSLITLLEKEFKSIYSDNQVERNNKLNHYFWIPQFDLYTLKNEDSVNNAIKYGKKNVKVSINDDGSCYYEWSEQSDIPETSYEDKVKMIYSILTTTEGKVVYKLGEDFRLNDISEYSTLKEQVVTKINGRTEEIREFENNLTYTVMLEGEKEIVTVEKNANEGDENKKIEYSRKGRAKGIEIPKNKNWLNADIITRRYFESGNETELKKALEEAGLLLTDNEGINK